MTEDRIEARNVSLYPDDWQIVNETAQKTGVRSISAALRIIIREFERTQQRPTEECHEQLITAS